MLTRSHRCLKCRHANALDVGVDRSLIFSARWPHIWQQKTMQFAVRRAGGERAREVLKVAVDVHVFVRDAPDVREAIRVQRVDVEHGHALLGSAGAPGRIVQDEYLNAAAAITLDPVAGAADDEQFVGIGRAIQRHIHGQRFAVTPRQRMKVRLDRCTRQRCRRKKFGAGAGIALRKGIGDVHGSLGDIASDKLFAHSSH